MLLLPAWLCAQVPTAQLKEQQLHVSASTPCSLSSPPLPKPPGCPTAYDNIDLVVVAGSTVDAPPAAANACKDCGACVKEMQVRECSNSKRAHWQPAVGLLFAGLCRNRCVGTDV